MKVVVTGGAGLVGSSTCRLFAGLGWDVVSIDSYERGRLWDGASTKSNMDMIMEEYSNVTNIPMDIGSDHIKDILRGCDLIVHTAAQPSHPYSVEHPWEDFMINAHGTLSLLEAAREVCGDVVFITCSSNKVYGDYPNYLPYMKVEGHASHLPCGVEIQRYEWDRRGGSVHGLTTQGITEDLPIDRSLHSPFGVSKVCADLYTQEYGRLYGMRTGVFRMGCITGSAAKAVEQHNWIPHFMGVNMRREVLKIYGYDGYQVRDIIHADDLAKLFLEFYNNPRSGEVYNVGGGYPNSISLREAMGIIEELTGDKFVDVEYYDEREGDHRIYYTDMTKVMSHYDWTPTVGLVEIFMDVLEGMNATD